VRAIVIEPTEARTRLVLRDVPDPVPGPADLLVKVRATALNRADLRRAPTHFTQGERNASAAIAGLEMAGEVVGFGAAVSGFRLGDRVMAMTGAGYAELAVVDHRLVIPVPARFDWAQAAATPTVFVTAHDALVSQGRLTAGQRVLIQGASTGTGIAAVQIARAWKAGRVFGTAGTEDKLARLRDLGCDTPINYRTGDVAKAVVDGTDGRGADLIIDLVGRGALAVNIAAAAIKGRIICVGRVGGTTDEINLDEFSRKRIVMTGTTFRTRSFEERAATVRRFREEVIPLFEAGDIAPVLDAREFNLEQAEEAQAYMAENRHFGKIILRVA
jgi:NADPH:quinone reductase-like Zn-dependent oxidoreductase